MSLLLLVLYVQHCKRLSEQGIAVLGYEARLRSSKTTKYNSFNYGVILFITMDKKVFLINKLQLIFLPFLDSVSLAFVSTISCVVALQNKLASTLEG